MPRLGWVVLGLYGVITLLVWISVRWVRRPLGRVASLATGALSLVLILLVLLASGCSVPKLAPDAVGVQFTTNPSYVANCVSLEIVDMHDTWHGAKALTRKLQNEAARVGGTHVLLVGDTDMNAFGYSQRGEIYRCPPKT